MFPRFSDAFACALALGLAACANSGTPPGLFGNKASTPKSVVVTDFVAASELPAIDSGFNTRLERHLGNYPILERRRRTLARVNDEIVATIIAVVRAGGMEAEPGSEQSLSFGDNVLLVGGRLELPAHGLAAQAGFGPGRGAVTADMTLTRFAAGSKAPLQSFSVETRRGSKVPAMSRSAATAFNAEIADALAAENAYPEKLSPEVEAQARVLGHAVGDKIVAYANEHDWLKKPKSAEARSPNVQMPKPRPAKRPEKKPAAAEPAPTKPTP
jgi:hypothetical protein